MFYLDLQFLSHPCYLTQDRIKARVFSALIVQEVTYLRRQVTLFLQPITSNNDITLCKFDVNVKNRTAVAGSVGFFILEYKLFKGKSVTSLQVLL